MGVMDEWARPNPVKENRSGLIGRPVDRYEGPLKVSGTAPYAYEVEPPAPPAYGVLATTAIARGRIASVDLSAVRAAPGVLLAWSHEDVPPQAPPGEGGIDFFNPGAKPALDTDRVRHFGQPMAVVVADTLENARAAAALVTAAYEAEPPAVDLQADLDAAAFPGGEMPIVVGDPAAAYAAAPVQLKGVWTTPTQNHCQMEPHASIAWWEGDDLIVHTGAQMVARTKLYLARTLRIDPARVRVLSRYTGGGFGGKSTMYEDLVLASLAARELGRPVKIAFTRQQMFHATVSRSSSWQEVALGATQDGRLVSLSHAGVVYADRRYPLVEKCTVGTRNLYATPTLSCSDKVAWLDMPTAGPLRAPGEAIGMLALECAMDELAEKVGLDPIELRLRNEPDADPATGRPFASRDLVRCLREGAQLFGWERRLPKPGQVRDGRWLVGMGMAAAIRGHPLMPAEANIVVDAEGVVTVRQGMTDIGTGSYTVLAQIAAETMGVPLESVRVEIGDSELPQTAGSGGQFGAASAGSALLDAGQNLRKAVAETAVGDPASPLHGGDAAALVFHDGLVSLGNRSESLASLVSRTGAKRLSADGKFAPPPEFREWSQQTYGAHFAEVGVDPVTGEVRMRRMLGVFACGRILNHKTARSQLTGGMIWGVGTALTEGNAADPRYGSLINQDLASYLLPVQADIGDLDAIMLEEPDDKAGPMGIKGVGELGISGAGAAVANAVYNACGVRVRDFPITAEMLLAAL